MKCPLCHTTTLQVMELEPNLSAQHCPSCHGFWIEAANYWKWLDHYVEDQTAVDEGDEKVLAVNEGNKALLCPQCGHIMLLYHVANDLSFVLDHCSFCGGVWCDAGEWETLKHRHLHTQMRRMFSTAWQTRLAREAHEKTKERLLAEKHGDEAVAEIRRIKSWLAEQPEQYELYALLHPDHKL